MSTTKSETGWSREWHRLADAVYWWRFDAKETPIAVKVFKSKVFTFSEDQGRHLNTFGGEWLGPITPADFEQLVALREAAMKEKEADEHPHET